MKLYANVTSERATKGQGGNERLDISLTVGNAKEQFDGGVIAMREIEEGIFSIVYYNGNNDPKGVNLARIETKGKK